MSIEVESFEAESVREDIGMGKSTTKLSLEIVDVDERKHTRGEHEVLGDIAH